MVLMAKKKEKETYIVVVKEDIDKIIKRGTGYSWVDLNVIVRFEIRKFMRKMSKLANEEFEREIDNNIKRKRRSYHA